MEDDDGDPDVRRRPGHLAIAGSDLAVLPDGEPLGMACDTAGWRGADVARLGGSRLDPGRDRVAAVDIVRESVLPACDGDDGRSLYMHGRAVQGGAASGVRGVYCRLARVWIGDGELVRVSDGGGACCVQLRPESVCGGADDAGPIQC